MRLGLITYRCDHEAGYFISRMECEKCNFTCRAEESSTEVITCPVDPTPFWSGLFLGILTGAVMCALGLKKARRAVASVGKNPDRTRGNSGATVYKEDKVLLRDDEGDRSETRSADSAENRGTVRSPKTKRKKTLMSAITGLLMFGPANACDVVITVDSGEVTMVCHDSVCAPQTSFPVRPNQEICIENHRGVRVSIKVTGVFTTVRYDLAYYTADYTVNARSVSNCCTDSDETNCWDKNGNCHRRAREKLETQVGNVSINSQCLWSNQNKLYTNCAYFAKTEREGDLFPVLQKSFESREVRLHVGGAPYARERTLVLNDFTPTRNLDLSTFGFETIPISVVGSFLQSSPFQSLLLYNSTFYYVDSAEPGAPRSGMLGDFQVTPKDNTTASAEPVITCEAPSGSCNCKCSYSQNSSIKTFQSRLQDHEPLQRYITVSTSPWVMYHYEREEKGEMLLQLGKRVSDSGQRRGKCDVGLLGVHGCVSCENPASIIFQANRSTIERSGVVPFLSNCTFDQSTVNCDYEPTELILQGRPDACWFRMPTLKKEFNVRVKYYAFGGDEPIVKDKCTRVYFSVGEALRHLVTSSTFIETFLATVIIIIISALSSLIVIRILHKGEPIRSANFVRNADDLLEL